MATEQDRQCDPVTTPEPGGRADARANRERVLAAAHELFAVRGMDAEIQEIGRRAGVGVGTIYRHFGNKEGLIRALIEQVEESYGAVIARAVAEPDGRASLRTLLTGICDLAETHRAIIETMRDAGIRPERPRDAEEQARRILQRAVESGIIREAFTVEFLLAYVRGLVVAYIDVRQAMTIAEAKESCTEAFFGGVVA